MKNLYFPDFTTQKNGNSTIEIQSNIRLIKAPSVWQQSNMGKGIVIADIDSGCQIDHPDLQANIIDVYNFTDEGSSNDVRDYIGHGTHTAGIICASLNQRGMVGVAPEGSLLILKVISKNDQGKYSSLIRAIKYASNWIGSNGEKVSVINISLGGSHDDVKLHDAIKEAHKKGIVIVAASGNKGNGSTQTKEIMYPGIYPEVIEVGAVGQDLKIPSFSDTNTQIDFVAPGVEILSTFPENRYIRMSGTSMAAPHVTGCFALYLKMLRNYIRNPQSALSGYSFFRKNAYTLKNIPKSAQGWGLIQLRGLKNHGF